MRLMTTVRWPLLLGIGFLSGLILWGLTSPNLFVIREMPLFLWLWAPVLAVSSLFYFSQVNPTLKRRALISGASIWAIVGIVFLIGNFLPDPAHTQFFELLLLHLPLIAWIGLGYCVLAWPASLKDRYGLLLKSFEVVMTAAFFFLTLGIFVGVTEMLFSTLQLEIPEIILRLIITLGLSVTGLAALALCYNPLVTAAQQSFQSHLLALLALVARVFSPLVLGVLIIYLCVIPFNFLVPFQEREVLVAYNLMLFAVLGLLVATTSHDFLAVPTRYHRPLRWVITLIASLAAVITLYALSATIYRTVTYDWTLNRLAIIGWNGVNLTVLIALVVGQLKAGTKEWVTALHGTFARAMLWWAVWVIGLVLLSPLIFI